MRDPSGQPLDRRLLEESEERFQTAFHANPSPTAILARPDARVVEVNEAFSRSFRLESEAAVGRTVREIGVMPSVPHLERLLAGVASGQKLRFEAPFRRTDEVEGHGIFALAPIELGGRPHMILLLQDVTEWRAANDALEQERNLVAAVLASLPGMFYMLDEGRLVRWNDEVERVTGLSGSQLSGMKAANLVADPVRAARHIEAALRDGSGSMEGLARMEDGSLVPYLFTGRRVTLGDKSYVTGLGIDIREQVKSRRVLERRALEESVFAQIAAATLSGAELPTILELAVRGVASALPAAAVRILETPDDDTFLVRAACPVSAAAGQPPDARLFWPEGLPVRGGGRLSLEAVRPLGFGSGIYYLIQGNKRPYGVITALADDEGVFGDDDERLLHSVALLLAGALEQQRLSLELAYRAEHDDLTGLPTRTTFERHLRSVLDHAKRSGAMLAVLFLDLDRFKLINDSLGHQAGDEVLRSVARRVEGALRSHDIVARHGGDEFVMLLPDVKSPTEVAHITARLIERFDEPFAVAGRELKVSTTVGIATFPHDGQSAEELLRAADTALYEGKARGRSSFHFFTREQERRVTERLELEADLRRAIASDAFELAFQPRIDLRSGDIVAVEALVRWRHPSAGLLLPDAFLPVASAIGLAVPLGELVLRKAFAQHLAWREQAGAPRRVAVNIAALHVMQPSFPEALAELLEEAGVAPTEVEIEIPEEALLRDEVLIAAHLNALRGLGVRTLISAFGANAAPLARLRSLPIDGLKVDAVFTSQMADPHGRQLVDAFIRLARGLEIEPIAEAIETSDQDQAVRELGFAEAQGNWYSAPLGPDELRGFFAAVAARGSREGRPFSRRRA